MKWIKASDVDKAGYYLVRSAKRSTEPYVSFIQKQVDEMYSYHDCLDYGEYLDAEMYIDAEFCKIEVPE